MHVYMYLLVYLFMYRCFYLSYLSYYLSFYVSPVYHCPALPLFHLSFCYFSCIFVSVLCSFSLFPVNRAYLLILLSVRLLSGCHRVLESNGRRRRWSCWYRGGRRLSQAEDYKVVSQMKRKRLTHRPAIQELHLFSPVDQYSFLWISACEVGAFFPLLLSWGREMERRRLLPLFSFYFLS